MNPNTQFERDLEQWLQAEAPASAPAGFHASVMDRARTLRQRPGWATSLPVRRFGRGRGLTLLAAAALLGGGALAAGSGILRLPTVVPPVPEPSVIAVATASPDATFPTPSESAAPSASPIPVAGPGGVWIPTGTLGTPRTNHTAVRLLDGRVLVVAGNSVTGDDLTSAELYDPATGTWSATAKMMGDGGDTATLLRDGKVLVAGGTAQLYDPATGTWTATGPMVNGADFVDAHATKTLLGDGKVLVVGFGGAQLYDPESGAWTATGKTNIPRARHMATLLPDGKVLVAGGWVEGKLTGGDPPSTDAAEVYDPVTGSWTEIADMQAPHVFGMMSQLHDGKVLVVTGAGPWEVYDPSIGTWTALPRPSGFNAPRALLSDDTVLMTDPDEDNPGPGPAALCTAAALYDPQTGSMTTASSMLRCVDGSSFTLLLDGTVLKAGDRECNDEGQCISNGAAELYVPAGVSLPPFSFPPPTLPVFPSPTPVPTPLPPAAGPVPPNARSWTVTVDNKSSEPATLFVAGDGLELVGSATPNVVPAGAKVKVTFLFPADDDGWIYVNPRPGEGGSLVNADQIGIPGKIVITADGQEVWASP